MSDYFTMKVSSSGSELWQQTYDHNSMVDFGAKIKIVGSRVLVSGVVQTGSTTYAIHNIGYLTSNGNFSTASTGPNSTAAISEIHDVHLDTNDNIYIVGSMNSTSGDKDGVLMKLNSNLTLDWTKQFDENGLDDCFYGVKTDSNNNVVVCGSIGDSASASDGTVIKYNSSGILLWQYNFNGEDNGEDCFHQICLNSDDEIIGTGLSFFGGNEDVYTFKLDAGGTYVWSIYYKDTSWNLNDLGRDVLIDGDGDIVVSGQIEQIPGKFKYSLIKYNELEVFENDVEVNSGQGKGFIVNKGQLLTSTGTEASFVKFYTVESRVATFFEDKSFNYVVRTNHQDSLVNDTIIKTTLDFRSCDQDCKVRAYEPSGHKHNFYIGSDRFEKIQDMRKILYQEVWRDIDIVFPQSLNNEMEMYVDALANVSDIKFTITGADSLSVDSAGTLFIHTGLGAIPVPSLNAFEMGVTGYTQTNWTPQWSVSDTTIQVSGVGSYSTSNGPLLLLSGVSECLEDDVIQDERLDYGTYFGGHSDDFVNDMEAWPTGDYFIGGFTANYTMFPEINIIVGSISDSQSYITRFKPDNSPEYTSVIMAGASVNGSSETYLRSIHITEYDLNKIIDNYIYACGSSTGNLATFGEPQVTNTVQTGTEAFVLQVDALTGVLIWLTVMDGSGEDFARDIKTNPAGEIFVVGQATNTNGSFPTTNQNGSYNNNSATQASFIAKFDQSKNLVWSTMFGGTGTDKLFCLDTHAAHGIIASGLTTSSDLYSEVVPNSYQDLTLTGSQNFFLVHFDQNEAYEWSSYLHGEAVYMNDYKTVAWIDDGTFLVGGTNISINGIDFENPGFGYNLSAVTNPQPAHQYNFISKFSANHDLIWSSLLDEGGPKSEFSTLRYANSKLYCGYTTSSDELLTVEIPTYFYEENLPVWDQNGTLFSSADGAFSVFHANNNAVLYSTLIGGYESTDKKVRGIGIIDDTNLVLTGETYSFYGCLENYENYGIPVKDAGSDYFKFNNLGIVSFASANQSGYILRFSFDNDVPLSSESHFGVEQIREIILYPNPTQRILNIQAIENIELIEVYNLQGQLVISQNQRLLSKQTTIEVETLAKGVYIILVQTAQGRQSAKFQIH